MRKRKSLSMLCVCSLFIIFSCVTINIYFPEAAVKEAAEEIVDEVRSEENEEKKQLESFIKKLSKINKDEAEQLKKELSGLELLKLKQEHLVKIIDLLPEDAQDLNKIFTDISLDEDETNKILEIIKKYK